jgi:hypothetical protein
LTSAPNAIPTLGFYVGDSTADNAEIFSVLIVLLMRNMFVVMLTEELEFVMDALKTFKG